MTITKDDLKAIMPNATIDSLDRFCGPLNNVFSKYEINSALRASAFISQAAVESESFALTRELWGSEHQKLYERDFSQKWPALLLTDRNYLAFSLGNSEIGDGYRFKGRGIFQITGRKNYQVLKDKFGIDFIAHPELLEGPVWACESAGDYWKSNGLNVFADIGDIDGVSDKVNKGHKTQKIGDANGYAQRLEFYERAKKILKA